MDNFCHCPLFSEHGAEEIGKVVNLDLQPRADGEWDLIFEAELHPIENESLSEAQLTRLLSKAVSIAFLEGPQPAGTIITIGIDVLAFREPIVWN